MKWRLGDLVLHRGSVKGMTVSTIMGVLGAVCEANGTAPTAVIQFNPRPGTRT
jgi:hypothetical protein